MTERELRQCRHQIGEADSEGRHPATWFVLTLVLSLGLCGVIWLCVAAIVSAWLQPWQ